LELLEEDTNMRIKEIMTAFSTLQRENLHLKRKITESVTQSNVDMQMDLLRSQFEEYQKIHTQELMMFKNRINSQRFEIETDMTGKA
jgi:hypothetical protein